MIFKQNFMQSFVTFFLSKITCNILITLKTLENMESPSIFHLYLNVYNAVKSFSHDCSSVLGSGLLYFNFSDKTMFFHVFKPEAIAKKFPGMFGNANHMIRVVSCRYADENDDLNVKRAKGTCTNKKTYFKNK